MSGDHNMHCSADQTDKETPLALQLADQLDQEQVRTVSLDIMHCKAADELRRLYEVNAELVEVLEKMLRQFTKTPSSIRDSEARCKAHAVLKKAKGDSND